MGFGVAVMAASAAVGAVSSLAAGASEAGAHKMQAGQYKAMAQESKVQTLQEEVARRRQFMDMAGTNILDLAGRDVAGDSGSFEAITEQNRERFASDVANARFIGDSRTRRYGLSARMENKAASAARLQSYFGAAKSVLTAGSQYYMSGTGSAGSTGSTEAGARAATASYGSPSGGPPGGW